MAAAQQAAAPMAGPPEPNHGLRILLIWLPLALAADLVIWFVWGPHLPPGVFLRESDVAHVSRAGRDILRRFVGLAGGDTAVG